MTGRSGFARAALTAAFLTLAATLLGCSAHSPGVGTTTQAQAGSGPQATPTTPESPAEPAEMAAVRLAEHYEVGATVERQALEARMALDEAYEEGRAALLAGDVEAAQDAFDRGLDGVLRLGPDLDAVPGLRERVETVLAGMHELAMESAAATVDPTAEEAHQAPARLAKVERGAHAWSGEFTLPMKDHPAVDSMVNFYTGRVKDRFEVGLQRFGWYAPTVQRILAEEGVPPDLAWLALVESNYNAQALSRARAKGLWQFIPSTGKRYGMDQGYWVDERADFEKATRGAARYLKDLHRMFGDWHLAIAAYNAGEGRIGRAIKNTGSRDFWEIRNTRHIRRETKDYVPALLAVLRIVRDPAAHGVDFRPYEPLAWETAVIDHCTDVEVLAECAGCTPDELRTLNPELRRDTTPGSGRYTLRVPVGTRDRLVAKVAELPPEKRLRWRHYTVERGDTLSVIASRNGSSVGAIMAANGLRNGNRIHPGQSLVIPAGGAAVAVATRAGGSDDHAPATRTTRHTHRVRPGETLSVIARRNGTSVSKLAQWNGLKDSDHIRVGQRLVLYGTAPTSVARASSGGGGSRGAHVVRSGDTLYGIARDHGVTVAQLRSWNGLSSRSVIRPGQRLALQGGSAESVTTHTVRKGDTLGRIASRYKASLNDVLAWNNLSARSTIRPGDRIKILSSN